MTMRASLRKLQLLTKRIQNEGTSEHVLCEVIVTLADEVVRLDDELTRTKHEVEAVRRRGSRVERMLPAYAATTAVVSKLKGGK